MTDIFIVLEGELALRPDEGGAFSSALARAAGVAHTPATRPAPARPQHPAAGRLAVPEEAFKRMMEGHPRRPRWQDGARYASSRWRGVCRIGRNGSSCYRDNRLDNEATLRRGQPAQCRKRLTAPAQDLCRGKMGIGMPMDNDSDLFDWTVRKRSTPPSWNGVSHRLWTRPRRRSASMRMMSAQPTNGSTTATPCS